MIGSTNYLKPLAYTPEESEEIRLRKCLRIWPICTFLIRQGLYELKNKYAGLFIFLNAMWVAAIFMLQKHQDQLRMQWPFGAKVCSIPDFFIFRQT